MPTIIEFYVVTENLTATGPFSNAQAWEVFASTPGSENGDAIVVRAASPDRAVAKVRPLFV